jgi:hypothetical protein
MDPKSTPLPNPVSLAIEKEFGLFQYVVKDLGFGRLGGKL